MSALTHVDNLYLQCFLAAMVGFGLNAYFPIAIQSLVEKLYPCSELAIATAMYIVAEAFGFSGNFFVNIPCNFVSCIDISFQELWPLGLDHINCAIHFLLGVLLQNSPK
jgi:hypothetical protein